MNMMEQIRKPEILSLERATVEHIAQEFLGKQQEFLNSEEYEQIIQETLDGFEGILNTIETVDSEKKVVTYDKFKKLFRVNDEIVTAGQIIAARHLDHDIVLPKDLDQSGLGKKLRKTYTEKIS
jgi:hypothetical protein